MVASIITKSLWYFIGSKMPLFGRGTIKKKMLPIKLWHMTDYRCIWISECLTGLLTLKRKAVL